MTAVAATLASGCTGGRAPNDPTPSRPAGTQTPSAPATTPEATAPPEPIEFAFRRPGPPCPPASALETLPLSGRRTYTPDPRLHERDNEFFMLCAYERAEAAGEGEDMVLEDHVLITSELNLYRSWGDSPYAATYPELPIWSDDPDDWLPTAWANDDRGVWWEGCGPDTPCASGEEPTVQTRAWQLKFRGHVGNLGFWVRVTYIGQRLPADVETRIIEIFRDFVLTAVDTYERID